jgi:hypothetical protein
MNEKIQWVEAINAERDKQMEIEGAKILYRVLKKEEEKAMLEQLKSTASAMGALSPNKSHSDVNLSLLLQEKQKIQKLETKKVRKRTTEREMLTY